MKKLVFIAIALLFLVQGIVFGAQGDLKPQTNCPVMGGKIDKDVYLDYQE